jgi:hypothetical protein
MKKKMTFALAFCNRGFMPGELIYGAREDMIKAVTDAGYDYIAMDAELTRYGGIETRDEGLLYAKWLKEHEGQYDGVIFSMPIFADENGAITEDMEDYTIEYDGDQMKLKVAQNYELIGKIIIVQVTGTDGSIGEVRMEVV